MKPHVIGRGTDEDKSTVVLETAGLQQSSNVSIYSITCELVSNRTGTRARGSIERRGQSQYGISYKPTIKGRHQLHIKVEGQHIRGSPFPCTAMSPVEKINTAILTIGGMNLPEGIAANQNGEVVVTEWNGHCVLCLVPVERDIWHT